MNSMDGQCRLTDDSTRGVLFRARFGTFSSDLCPRNVIELGRQHVRQENAIRNDFSDEIAISFDGGAMAVTRILQEKLQQMSAPSESKR